MSRVLALDDRDPSILYSAGWSQGGSVEEYNNTTSFTSLPGRNATLSFRGTGISVYGTIPARARGRDDSESAYVLDGGRPVRFTAASTNRIQYNQLFFEANALPDTTHNLTITNLGDETPLFLDVMLIMVTPEVANTTTTSATTTTASTTTSATSTTPTAPLTVTVTAPASTTDDPASTAVDATDNTGATSGSGAAALAGGVIAGVVVLFLVVLGFIFYRRRANRNKDVDFPDFTSPPLAPSATPAAASSAEPPTSQWADTPVATYPAYGYDTPTNPNTPYNPYNQYIPPSQAQLINPYDQAYANQGYANYGMYR